MKKNEKTRSLIVKYTRPDGIRVNCQIGGYVHFTNDEVIKLVKGTKWYDVCSRYGMIEFAEGV